MEGGGLRWGSYPEHTLSPCHSPTLALPCNSLSLYSSDTCESNILKMYSDHGIIFRSLINEEDRADSENIKYIGSYVVSLGNKKEGSQVQE